MERIGIFGGTYNPPHLGHFQAAQQALEALQLRKLLLVPNLQAPHKPLLPLAATPQQRLQMLRLALTDPRLEVSDVELNRQGPSYTVDTVYQLQERYPHAELVVLMGSDMFLSFSKWSRWQEILQNASLGVFCRGIPGEWDAMEEKKAELAAQGATVYLLKNPVVDISSTQLRRLLVFRGAGEFLPERVEAFIRENDLYGVHRDYRNLPVEELEQVVVSLLKPSRVAHVLGCRDTAVALARRWGANVEDAERAALLHDITKALDGHLQLALCRAYGVQLDAFSLQYPKTLHALTGSMVAQRIFGENQAVTEAICCHTTGKANMNMLDKILYVADYMEPNRDFLGVEELRYLTTVDMTQALIKGLQMTVDMLKKQGNAVSPGSREALEYLNVRV